MVGGGKSEVVRSLPLQGVETRELFEEKVERVRMLLLMMLEASMSSGDFSELLKLEYPLEQGVRFCLERAMKSAVWWLVTSPGSWREEEEVEMRGGGMNCWEGEREEVWNGGDWK